MTKRFDPKEYWEKRIRTHPDLQATGHHKFGLDYNQWMYQTQLDCLNELIEKWGIQVTGKRVLDVGTGTGFFLNYYRELGAGAVTGIDITQASIEYLRAKFPDAQLLVADISAESVSIDEKFDVISAMGVLYHIVEEVRFERALQNIASLLKPGGHLFLTDSLDRSRVPAARHARLRPLEAFRPVLESSNLHVLEILPLYYYSNRSYIPFIGPWVLTRLKLGKLLYQLDKRQRRRGRSNGSGLKILLARKESWL
jgi:SAM-dependent methyltransferase